MARQNAPRPGWLFAKKMKELMKQASAADPTFDFANMMAPPTKPHPRQSGGGSFMGMPIANPGHPDYVAPTAAAPPVPMQRKPNTTPRWLREARVGAYRGGKALAGGIDATGEGIGATTDSLHDRGAAMGIVQGGQQRGGWLGAGQRAGGHMLAAAGSTDNAMKGTADMMRAGGSMAGMIPVVGKPIEAIAKLGAVAFESVEKLKQWGNKLHESNMQFSQYSSLMSQVGAEARQREIRRSAKTGDELAESAQAQSRANQRLKDSTQEYEVKFKKFWNNVGAYAQNDIAKGFEWFAGKKKPSDPVFDDVDYLIKGPKGEMPPWYVQYQRPVRFR